MHWRAPTTMLSSFTAGIAFAIGHHFFYQSLHQTAVESATFDQQINIGIGTAFAFLVRAFLVIAVGVAFVQVLWQRLLRKDITIARIDSMTQLLGSIFDLFNFKTIWQHPLPGCLAFISWALPFAAIVPPATLSVQGAVNPQSQTSPQNLPNIDFSKVRSFSKSYSSSQNPEYDVATSTLPANWFGGANETLSQLSTVTALQNRIPQIQAPAQNSSLSLPFVGPAIQCLSTSSDVIRDFDKIFACNFSNPSNPQNNKTCGFYYTYLSWVPNAYARVPLGAANGALNFINQYQSSEYGLTTIGGFQNEPTMLYIGTRGENGTWSMLNCSLYNASYTVEFNYRDGSQTLSTRRTLLNGVPFRHQVSSTVVANITGWEPVGTEIRRVSRETESYYGVMDAFGRLVVGGSMAASSSRGGGDNVLATSIFSTGLAQSKEFTGRNISSKLSTLAEQLFENITVELFSNANFVSVNASKFPATDVTLFSYPNEYVYTWRRLVLAYGLAILFATIAVAIGGYVLLTTRESYNYTFSTILRTTRGDDLDELVQSRDMRGQDPLPKKIAKTTIRVGATRPLAVLETELSGQPQETKLSPTIEYRPIRGEEQTMTTTEASETRGRPLIHDFDHGRDDHGNRRSISPLSFEMDPRRI